MLDAFTSDAVPVHLMTYEAIELYLSMLNEDGFIIFNISNRYLDLRQPLGALAHALDKPAFNFFYVSYPFNDLTYDSAWVVIFSSDKFVKKAKELEWVSITEKFADVKPWTDNYSPVLSIFQINSASKIDEYERWMQPSINLRAFMNKALGDRYLNQKPVTITDEITQP